MAKGKYSAQVYPFTLIYLAKSVTNSLNVCSFTKKNDFFVAIFNKLLTDLCREKGGERLVPFFWICFS